MDHQEDIKPISYLKTNSVDLLNQLSGSNRPTILTRKGVATAVIQNIESYQKQKNILRMLKIIALGNAEIEKGLLIEQSKLFKAIDKNSRHR